ncbi:hypothetical protein GWP57_10355 [Gammaproteobacteria bacterium]|jgi:hypothetical protein|nr:hypothetical protein [Gammaproteobacteria bacterium]
MKPWPLLLLLPITLLAQDDPWDDEDWGDDDEAAAWAGFIEAGLGTRLHSDPLLDERNTLEEVRWRIESEWQPGAATVSFKADAAYDGIEAGWDAEIRDLTAAFTLAEDYDIKLGRQVQTWGTGDLLFLNDLFPKDFVSFFAGRDDEYLKAAGNAIRVTRFSEMINVDFAWTPVFEPDVYLTGERYSFFSPLAGENIAPRPPLTAVEPDEKPANGEFALRLFRTFESREIALYAYRGFFKQPTALTANLEPTFAPLTAIGASLRQPLGPGLLNVEGSYYRSRDDRDGSDPFVPNDQLRMLAGYEWEARPNFTVGLQYYLEWTGDHSRLIDNSPSPEFEPDEFRHLLTNRLTYRAGRDKHTLSLFTFFSPSDSDFYLRPSYSYRHSDEWSLTAGGNLFGGSDAHTFFSQLQDASNLYLRVRYHY